MISIIRDLLTRSPEPGAKHSADEMRLAAAALLVEAAKMDGRFEAVERKRILALLCDRFNLDAAAADELVDLADAETDRNGDLYRFTSTVRQNFDEAERVAMIEMLWDVAYADGIVDDFEANLLRKVAGLLYVTDRDSGDARKRVLGRMARDDGIRPEGVAGRNKKRD